MKKRLLSIVLVLSILILSMIVTGAKEVEKKAIKGNVFLGDEVLINKDYKKHIKKNKDYKTLKTSLGIQIQNIDLDSLHDTNPVDLESAKMLKKMKKSDNYINDIDAEDAKEILYKELLNEKQIEQIKIVYKELVDIDIAKWTYNDFMSYAKSADDKKYEPSKNIKKELKKRDITLADARYLLSYYQNYDNILSLSDDEIAVHLRSYYELKIQYYESLQVIEFGRSIQENNSLASLLNISASAGTTVYMPNDSTYRYAYFPGIGYDYYHKDSYTHWYDYALEYSAGTQKLWEAIFHEYSSFNVSMAWGRYYENLSISKGGAHEGIDFNSRISNSGRPLYAHSDGTWTRTSSRYGLGYLQSGSSRSFYMHMTDRASNGTKTSSSVLGKEGGVGPVFNANGDYLYTSNTAFGPHLHFQYYIGTTQTACDTWKNHILESNNPYYIKYSSPQQH